MAEEALLPGQSPTSSIKLPPAIKLWSIICRGVDLCYQGLKRPWLFLATMLTIMGLLAGALWLPQLPGQLSGDATASARWLLGVSSSYGTVGGLLRILGIFNALHSPLLQLALALLALMLCVYLSDALAVAWRFYRLPVQLADPIQPIATPVTATLPQVTYRYRQAVASGPALLHEEIERYLGAKFPYIEQTKPSLGSLDVERHGNNLIEFDQQVWRLLAIRDARWLYLRPLLIVGALLALGVVWWIAIAGWQIVPPLLAPSDLYRYAQHDLELRYAIGSEATAAHLDARIDTFQTQQTMLAATGVWLGPVKLQIQPGAPALVVRIHQGEASLERAGQSKVADLLGLVFPTIGSEESIVLRKQTALLRIVRTTESGTMDDLSTFQVELYRGKDLQPERINMHQTQQQMIPIDKQVTLELTLLPSLAVTASYLPGLWLLWLALLLCLIGATGFLRRPAYLLIQIGPWPDLRSVIVLQSNGSAELAALQDFLDTIN